MAFVGVWRNGPPRSNFNIHWAYDKVIDTSFTMLFSLQWLLYWWIDEVWVFHIHMLLRGITSFIKCLFLIKKKEREREIQGSNFCLRRWRTSCFGFVPLRRQLTPRRTRKHSFYSLPQWPICIWLFYALSYSAFWENDKKESF